MLVAEGATASINQTVDVVGLLGTVAAQVDWGDGQRTPATLSAQPSSGPLRFRFDYSLDRSGLFSNAAARGALERAGQSVLRHLTDDLRAISPGGVRQWSARILEPSTGSETLIPNLGVAANEIVIYVGGRDLPGNQLGLAVTGGFAFPAVSNITPAQQAEILAFRDDVQFRGEAGASGPAPTDYGTWGGSISFDSGTRDWYFGVSEDGIGANQHDFFTTASHELVHILGFGLSPSWNRLSNGSTFAGANARAVYAGLGGSGNVPIQDVIHWSDSLITVLNTPTVMADDLPVGTRRLITPLDLAALQDIGWQRATTSIVVSANHVYADNGNYEAEIILTGSIANTITQSVDFAITNVAPTLVAPAPVTVVAGSPTPSLTWTYTDPGFSRPTGPSPTNETATFSINWGDGTAATSGSATVTRNGSPGILTEGRFTAMHTFAAAGVFNVVATVTDDDGGSRSVPLTITVTSPAPQPLSVAVSRDEVAENATATPVTLTIRRPSSTAANSATVQITASSNRFQFNPTATFAAGVSSIVVPVTPINNTTANLQETVTLTIAGAGFLSTAGTLTILDDENPFQNIDDRFNVSGDDQVTALDALQIINALNTFGGERNLTGQPRLPGDANWDVNGDYRVTALDALLVINELNRRESLRATQPEPIALRLPPRDDQSNDAAILELTTASQLF